MKVAIVSLSGSIGKTCLSAHMFYPRLGNPTVFAVETINETVGWYGLPYEEFSGDQFDELIARILRTSNALIDTGASNIETFVKHLVRHDGAHEEIDFFIVPVPVGAKEQSEAVKTTELLRGLASLARKFACYLKALKITWKKNSRCFWPRLKKIDT